MQKTPKIIVIPTAGTTPENRRRVDRAYEEGRNTPSDIRVIYLINGKIDQPASTSQVKGIYNMLRNQGVEPRNIRLEGRSANSLENILIGFSRLETMGVFEVDMVSYPRHLDRLKFVLEKAKKEGVIDRSFRVHRLETSETFGESVYGIVSNWLYRYELRKGVRNPKKPWFHEPIKRVIRVINYFTKHF